MTKLLRSPDCKTLARGVATPVEKSGAKEPVNLDRLNCRLRSPHKLDYRRTPDCREA
jgi:hypothetical protein